jgi:uncharacterized protein YegL
MMAIPGGGEGGLFGQVCIAHEETTDVKTVVVVFCVDVSSSMSVLAGSTGKSRLEHQVDALKRLARLAADFPGDNVAIELGIITFDSEARVVLPIGPINMETVAIVTDRFRANGGTSILRAREEAITLVRPLIPEGCAGHVIVFTDGEDSEFAKELRLPQAASQLVSDLRTLPSVTFYAVGCDGADGGTLDRFIQSCRRGDHRNVSSDDVGRVVGSLYALMQQLHVTNIVVKVYVCDEDAAVPLLGEEIRHKEAAYQESMPCHVTFELPDGLPVGKSVKVVVTFSDHRPDATCVVSGPLDAPDPMLLSAYVDFLSAKLAREVAPLVRAEAFDAAQGKITELKQSLQAVLSAGGDASSVNAALAELDANMADITRARDDYTAAHLLALRLCSRADTDQRMVSIDTSADSRTVSALQRQFSGQDFLY